jgi:2',3'-cyclic-nucleotide 2'-phosphodiesterase (5'-nucleotidase family)
MGTTKTLVLLHTNDEHSHVLGDTPELDDFPAPTSAGTGVIKGGLSRRAVVLKQERDAATAAGADTLTVSAGDNSMGSLSQVAFTRTAPDLTLLKAVGYDLTTVGNHELDFGPDGLASAVNAAKAMGGLPVVVATNIQFPNDPKVANLQALYDDTGADASKPIHKTWMVTTPNGLKVGFMGIIGADAAYSVPNKAPLTFSLPAGAKESDYTMIEAQQWVDLQASADKLHGDGADVVVLLSHAGIDPDDHTKGEDYMIATHVTGIDVIVSGHTHAMYPIEAVTNPTSNKPVYIQQANYYGYDLGKITIKVDPMGVVSADMANSKIIPIDDTIVASDSNVNMLVNSMIRDIETTVVGNGKSFVGNSLFNIFGTAQTDNGTAGNLYFKTVATTGFDLDGHPHLKEAPFEVMYADASLYAGDKYKPVGQKNDLAIIASGVIRADLLAKGKTGNIGFSDLFKLLSLGSSPADGSPGYPLCRFSVYPVELRGALELTTSYAYSNRNADGFYFIPSGLKFEYDTSRPPFDFSSAANVFDPTKGRLTKIWLLAQGDHANNLDNFPNSTLVYDAVAYASNNGWAPGITPYGSTLMTVVATSYFASYAASQGISLKNDAGMVVMDVKDVVMHRADNSEIKDWEGLGEFLVSKGGAVPSTYNAGSGWMPHRVICDGPLCVQ